MKEDYDIHPYIESIYRFCASKIHDPYDAEDLAGEILLHKVVPVKSLSRVILRELLNIK